MGEGETAAKNKGRGASGTLFFFGKRPSSLRGKWHHCSAPDDRAMRHGCLNSDITVGSWSPIHHRQRRGKGTKGEGPGREEIITQHKILLHSGCQNAPFHRTSMDVLIGKYESIVHSPLTPPPHHSAITPVHQAEASPRSSGGSESLTKKCEVAVLSLH